MARVLMMSTGEKGHTNPMIGVAQWLRRAGHRVAWLCIPEPAPQLVGLGIEMLPLPGAPPPPELVTAGAALARLVRDPPALRTWIKTLLLDAVPAQIEPVRAAMRAFAPDVVALDPMLYQGVIAAHEEGIPYAGISSSLNPVTPDDIDCELQRTVRWLAPARAELFARHGMAPAFRVCDCLSPFLTTVFATDAYVGDAPLPAATALVGPSIAPEPRGDEPAFPWEKLEDPVVYASFGSQISWQPEAFRVIAEAAAPLGVTLVLSAGDLADGGFADGLPGRVVAVRYAPQLALLERARVLVTHGGANSVMEALTAGVPVLISPVCNDQPLQAHFVAKSGVGIALDLAGATVSECRRALAELLGDGPHRRRAAAVSESYRAHDGARAAAERVAEVAR